MKEITEVIEKLQATRNRVQVLHTEEHYKIMRDGKGSHSAIRAYSNVIDDIDSAIDSLVLLRMKF